MTIKIPTPEKMQKFPWATVVVSLFAVCVMLLVYIVTYNCDSDKWEKLYYSERNKNDLLNTALLIKNGIIFKQVQEKKELDSTIREKIEDKAKKIINGQ